MKTLGIKSFFGLAAAFLCLQIGLSGCGDFTENKIVKGNSDTDTTDTETETETYTSTKTSTSTGPLVRGMNVENSSATAINNINSAALNIDTIKIYAGVDGKTDFNTGQLRMINNYKNKDLTVTLVVKKKANVPTFLTFLNTIFSKKYANRDLVRSVDRWELGNEFESDDYWDSDFKSFAQVFTAPAAKIIHNAGGKVVSGASWGSAQDVIDMINYLKAMSGNYFQYIDYIGYHGYQSTAHGLDMAFSALENQKWNKPIVVTEWICRGPSSWDAKDKNGNRTYTTIAGVPAWMRADWKECNDEFWPIIRDRSFRAYYFKDTATTQMAGRAAVLTADGSVPSKSDPSRIFYDMFRLFPDKK